MKFGIFFAFLAALTGACFAAPEPPDYRDRANWVIYEAEKKGTNFDVFYVYPTLVSTPSRPYMEWRDDPPVRDKTSGFAAAQTGIFGDKARIFAPYVRQLEYSRITHALAPANDWRNSPALKPGADDTLRAFRHYLKHLNGGRPYILFGHSQGATELYMALRHTPEATVENGFVAAYLLGMPRLPGKAIAADFSARGITPATGGSDLGVIIGWNTQSPEAANPVFTGNRTYCINPLNWRTDGTPAEKTANTGAFFYDYRTKRSKTVPFFCGARIDVARGALIVDLPVNSRYDARGFMGRGVFHMNDVWFFAGNIRDNAARRTEAWRNRYGGGRK